MTKANSNLNENILYSSSSSSLATKSSPVMAPPLAVPTLTSSSSGLSSLDKQLRRFNQDQAYDEDRTQSFLAKVNAHITSQIINNNQTNGNSTVIVNNTNNFAGKGDCSGFFLHKNGTPSKSASQLSSKLWRLFLFMRLIMLRSTSFVYLFLNLIIDF